MANLLRGFFSCGSHPLCLGAPPKGEQKKVNSGAFFLLRFYNKNSFARLPENLNYTFFCCADASIVLFLELVCIHPKNMKILFRYSTIIQSWSRYRLRISKILNKYIQNPFYYVQMLSISHLAPCYFPFWGTGEEKQDPALLFAVNTLSQQNHKH